MQPVPTIEVWKRPITISACMILNIPFFGPWTCNTTPCPDNVFSPLPVDIIYADCDLHAAVLIYNGVCSEG